MEECVFNYQEQVVEEVELYSANLISIKEDLQKSRAKVHQWFRDGHVTEQIKDRDQMSEELKEYLNAEIEVYSHRAIMPPLHFASMLYTNFLCYTDNTVFVLVPFLCSSRINPSNFAVMFM